MLGESSLEVATTWLNLGGVLRAAGKLEEAESACRQCLDIRERQLGSQHTDTAAAQIGKQCACCVLRHIMQRLLLHAAAWCSESL